MPRKTASTHLADTRTHCANIQPHSPLLSIKIPLRSPLGDHPGSTHAHASTRRHGRGGNGGGGGGGVCGGNNRNERAGLPLEIQAQMRYAMTAAAAVAALVKGVAVVMHVNAHTNTCWIRQVGDENGSSHVCGGGWLRACVRVVGAAPSCILRVICGWVNFGAPRRARASERERADDTCASVRIAVRRVYSQPPHTQPPFTPRSRFTRASHSPVAYFCVPV